MNLLLATLKKTWHAALVNLTFYISVILRDPADLCNDADMVDCVEDVVLKRQHEVGTHFVLSVGVFIILYMWKFAKENVEQWVKVTRFVGDGVEFLAGQVRHWETPGPGMCIIVGRMMARNGGATGRSSRGRNEVWSSCLW